MWEAFLTCLWVYLWTRHGPMMICMWEKWVHLVIQGNFYNFLCLKRSNFYDCWNSWSALSEFSLEIWEGVKLVLRKKHVSCHSVRLTQLIVSSVADAVLKLSSPFVPQFNEEKRLFWGIWSIQLHKCTFVMFSMCRWLSRCKWPGTA